MRERPRSRHQAVDGLTCFPLVRAYTFAPFTSWSDLDRFADSFGVNPLGLVRGRFAL